MTLDSAHDPRAAVRLGGWRQRFARNPAGSRKIAYFYIAPALIVYAAVILGPIVYTGWLSLHDWDGLTPKQFIGLGNYREIWSDEDLRGAFYHAFVLIGFYCVLPLVLGLILAGIMSRHHIKGFLFFRTVIFLPAVVTPAVVALTWRWIYAGEGSLNQALTAVGLESWTRSWLGDFDFALYAVGGIGTWVYTGLALVLFLAGIQRVPTEMFEAARIDGASLFQEIWHITIPSIRGEIVIVATLTMIGALRTFELIWLTTKGGPGRETEVPSIAIFKRAFLQGQLGSAAALSVVLACIVLAASLTITRLGGRTRS